MRKLDMSANVPCKAVLILKGSRQTAGPTRLFQQQPIPVAELPELPRGAETRRTRTQYDDSVHVSSAILPKRPPGSLRDLQPNVRLFTPFRTSRPTAHSRFQGSAVIVHSQGEQLSPSPPSASRAGMLKKVSRQPPAT